jgi:hypothetical protein
VGIAVDAKNHGVGNPVRPAIYVPYTLNMRQGTQVLVRSAGPPLRLVHALRLQLMAVNPDQQTYNNVEDLDNWITDEAEWRRST